MITKLLHGGSSRSSANPLLVLLDSEDVVRADAFRQLYEREGHEPLLDALTDAEVDPVMRGWLVKHLRLEVGDS